MTDVRKARSRIDFIVESVRRELEQRPHMLEGGGLQSLLLHLYFEGEAWDPKVVVARPEFKTVVEERRRRA